MPRSDVPDVLVLGAGLVGLACARALAGRGLAVRVLERGEPGEEASAAAAGMLAPLAEVPQPGPMFETCRAARDRWRSFARELEDESGVPVDLDTHGAVVPAFDAEDEAFLDHLEAAARRLGEPVARWAAEGARRRIPDLHPALRRGLHLPGELRVDNQRATRAALAACRGAGVEVVTGRTVERVELARPGVRVAGKSEHGPWRETAPVSVLALGAWSGTVEILRDDGALLPALPVHPVRGQMLALGGIDWPWTGTLRGRNRYAVRRPPSRGRGRGGLLVGATVEDAGFAAHPTAAGLANLTAWVRRVIPGAADAPVERVWAGLRPGTPDGLPWIGPYPAGGDARLVVATGHYRNGILLAPWTADQVAELVTSGTLPQDLAAFRPGRFRDAG